MTVEICFTDNHKMILKNVKGYNWNGETHMLSVTVGDYKQFFNTDYVMYIGRREDLVARVPA